MAPKPLLYDGPPATLDSEEASNDVRCQGVLGVALNEALVEIMEEDTVNETDENEGPDIQLDQRAKDSILNVFGRSFRDKSSLSDAPSVLLKGRVAHYCRVESRWRIQLEDVQLKRRHPLPAKRRKVTRQPIWKACNSDYEDIREGHGEDLLLNLYDDDDE